MAVFNFSVYPHVSVSVAGDICQKVRVAQINMCPCGFAPGSWKIAISPLENSARGGKNFIRV